MESSSEAENVEGRLGVILGQRGQIQTDSRMEVKLGGWSRRPMRKLLKVSSRSPGVIQDQMAYHCCMDLKLIHLSSHESNILILKWVVQYVTKFNELD